MSIGSFSSAGSVLPSAQADMYTDLNSLQKIKQMGRGDDGEKSQALEAVAKQFESVFLNMMMKSMREANEAFKDDSMSSSNEMDFYQQMFDQQLALTLSKDGVGIADALVRQLQRQIQIPSSPVSAEAVKNPFDLYGDLKKFMESKAGEIDASSQDRKGNQQLDTSALKSESVKHSHRIASVDEFKSTLKPMAEQAARELGVDPKVILSQAALETGWGQHMIGKPNGDNSFNLFGIKASNGWQGDIATVNTLEYEQGVARQQQAKFRAYASYEESFRDYVDFIKNNGRYSGAIENSASPESYVKELQSAGYATDPEYANKILNIAKRHFDSVEVNTRGDQG